MPRVLASPVPALAMWADCRQRAGGQQANERAQVVQAFLRQTRKRLLNLPYQDYLYVRMMVLQQARSCAPSLGLTLECFFLQAPHALCQQKPVPPQMLNIGCNDEYRPQIVL